MWDVAVRLSLVLVCPLPRPRTCGRDVSACCVVHPQEPHTHEAPSKSIASLIHEPRLHLLASHKPCNRYKRLCHLRNDYNVQFGHLSWAGGCAQLLVTKLVKHSCYFNEISQLPPRLRLLSQRLIFLTIFSALAGVLCPPRVSVLQSPFPPPLHNLADTHYLVRLLSSCDAFCWCCHIKTNTVLNEEILTFFLTLCYIKVCTVLPYPRLDIWWSQGCQDFSFKNTIGFFKAITSRCLKIEMMDTCDLLYLIDSAGIMVYKRPG